MISQGNLTFQQPSSMAASQKLKFLVQKNHNISQPHGTHRNLLQVQENN